MFAFFALLNADSKEEKELIYFHFTSSKPTTIGPSIIEPTLVTKEVKQHSTYSWTF